METKTNKGKEIRIPGPDHPITISPAVGKVRVTVAGTIVVESTRALRLVEKGYPHVYYLPRQVEHSGAVRKRAVETRENRHRERSLHTGHVRVDFNDPLIGL